MLKYIISVSLTVEINKDISTVFSKVTDVKNWDKLSTNFEKAELVMQQEDMSLTRMTSKHNHMTFDRYTLREARKDECMKFEHITLSFPIQKHFGTWTFTRKDGQTTLLRLEHNFKIKFGYLGFLFGKAIIAPYFFKTPTGKMLQHMKHSIENN